MIEMTKLVASGNFVISTSKCLSSFFCAFCDTNEHLSLTDPMLFKYAAGSIVGSGALGRSTFGKDPAFPVMLGVAIEVVLVDLKVGDLRLRA